MDNWNVGVTFFLCLSSFLITFILITEKNIFGQVNIKNFYKRRLLRIWPLYYLYLIIILLFFLNFNIPFEKNMIYYYVFFGSNIPFLLENSILLLGHYWSISTEEQYYILYTFIVNKVSNLSIFILKVLSIFLLLKLTARIIDIFLDIPILTTIFQVFSFDTMLIGSYGALLYINHKNFIQKFLFFKWLQYLTLFVIILIFFSKFHILSIIDNQIIAVFELILIYNVLLNKNTIFKIENRIFDYIGMLKYVLYDLYAYVFIFILIYLCK
jgi:peptidoglycan/LPS O-acetylase OafA/YrhL